MEDPFDFQTLRVQQPRKLLPSRANYEIFSDERQLVALVNEADTHTRLALLRQTMPDTRVLTVATPAGAPILTLIKQTSEWTTELLGPDEERIGLIRTEGSRRHYTLIDREDRTVSKVEGDLGLKQFTAKSPKGEKFALVRKTFAGFAKEMLTPADNYKVQFIAPADQPARTMIVMLPIVLDLTLYGPV